MAEKKIQILVGALENVTSGWTEDIFLAVCHSGYKPMAAHLADLPGSRRFLERIAKIQWWGAGTRRELNNTLEYLASSQAMPVSLTSYNFDLYNEEEDLYLLLLQKAEALIHSLAVIGSQFEVAISVSKINKRSETWTVRDHLNGEEEGMQQTTEGWEVVFNW